METCIRMSSRLSVLFVALAALFCLPGLVAKDTCPAPTKSNCAKDLAACGEKGCSAENKLPPDPDLNVQKNRSGQPSQFKRYTFAQFSALNSKAVNKKGR